MRLRDGTSCMKIAQVTIHLPHVHLLYYVNHDSLHLMRVLTSESREGCNVAHNVRGLPQ